MKHIGIFYGSTTGTTAELSGLIAKQMGVDSVDIHDVAKTAPSAVAPYDLLILGCSTWGDGDMQADMADFLDGVQSLDLSDKYVALFGSGDETMSDTFCNAVGQMYRRLRPTGAKFVGDYNTTGYEYSHTDADVDGNIVGLLIDQVNHPSLTQEKVAQWVADLKSQTGN